MIKGIVPGSSGSSVSDHTVSLVFDDNRKVNIEFVDSVGIMKGEMRMFCISPHSLAVSLD